LIKDIVTEKASNYISIAQPRRSSEDTEQPAASERSPTDIDRSFDEYSIPAFSLLKFIPLLAERIYTLNPFTRMFLVGWIKVLDSVPDLELISHLPAFLKGLLQFLSDPNDDVRAETLKALSGFLEEIKKIAEVKKMLSTRRSSQVIEGSDAGSNNIPDRLDALVSPNGRISLTERLPEDVDATDDWVPGQDTHIDYANVINILVPFLSDTGNAVQFISYDR
jgi:vacuole morphology and inheritance protein 14